MQRSLPALSPLSEPAPSPKAGAPLEEWRDARLSELPAHLEPLRVLGQGGSSVVYEALHTRLKVKVALKLLTVDGPQAALAQRRMLREAELYALLDDPHIPRVYDVNELPDGTPYVVMEMVPGESLEEVLARRGALAPTDAFRITRELLLALSSVHQRGVLHRDVKPANVILTVSDEGPCEVRLVDFGIAKMSTHGTGEEAVTLRGTLVGTPHYMAPERLSGHAADASTDVYAVGIMLYEMLAGMVPFTGSSLAGIMAAVLRQEPVPLHRVSPELSAFVLQAMARDPAARFRSADAMLAALDALVPNPTSTTPNARPRSRRRGKFLLVTALLSALLVAAGVLLAERRSEARAEGIQQSTGTAAASALSAVEARGSAREQNIEGTAASTRAAAAMTQAASAKPALEPSAVAGPNPVIEEPDRSERRRHRSRASRRAKAASTPEGRDGAAFQDDRLPENPY